MYRRMFTVQKNPTKLFENGMIRLYDVQNLFVPLRFLLQEKKDGKEKLRLNPYIRAVQLSVAQPNRIDKAGENNHGANAIDEYEGVIAADQEGDYASWQVIDRDKMHSHRILVPPNCRADYECFTHYAIRWQRSITDPTERVSQPLISSIDIEVTDRRTIEHLLRTIPVNGDRYVTPMHACLFDVTIEAEHLSDLELASKEICMSYKRAQDPRVQR